MKEGLNAYTFLVRYEKLDYGWTNSIFGCIALGVGLPAVLLLWRYGKKLRQKSPYCANEG